MWFFDPIDYFCLDRVFQPIGDWAHKRFGIHPQRIAEFFGMGAVLAVIARDIIRQASPIQAALAIGVSLIILYVIHRPIALRGGRNPKRWMYGGLRFMYLLFIVLNLATAAYEPSLWFDNQFWLDMANSFFFWLGLSFASLDEPPPREYRRSIFGWANT